MPPAAGDDAAMTATAEPDPPATGTPLPEALEQAAYEALLAEPPAGRERAFAELLAANPAHAAALRRLQRQLAAGENALGDSGLAEPPPPAALGPYRLLRQLGAGGFGVVWLAEQNAPLQRLVAIKRIRPHLDTTTVLRRFALEREALARFDHPAIAKVLDAGTAPTGEPFLVTEYVPGVPLAQYCIERRLALTARLQLLLQVCDGVQHAHQRGVVHRDLKPSNVLVCDVDGTPRVKIIDWGLARAIGEDRGGDHTRAGALVGTPEYMSPEQAEGLADLDLRADVYALGVMLYELLVGDLPFGRARWRTAGMTELVEMIRRTEPPAPSARIGDRSLARSVRGDLDWIVHTALHKERDRRYATVAQFAADLQAFLGHRPVSVGAPGVGYRLRRFVRRHRAPVALAATALLALTGGLLASLAALARAERAEQAATDHLARYLDLADVLTLRELRRAAAAAWPATPERIGQYHEWLRQAAALLARDAARGPETTIEATSGAERFRREAMHGLRVDLADFAADDGDLASVRRRLAFAERLASRVDGDDGDWRRAAAAVAADARFHGLVLAPQSGLAPLGADPDSGLQEFAVLQTGAVPGRDDAGRLQLDEDSAMVLVLVPGGASDVGAQDRDPQAARYEVQPQISAGAVRTVRLDAFFCGKHEMTRGQWRRVFGDDPSQFAIGTASPDGPLTAMHPVDNLDWARADEAMRRLDLTLPTEAQWEHACRAGSSTRWCTGDDVASLQGAANLGGREAAWMPPQRLQISPELDDGVQFMAPIGRFRANGFGLHDVHGNYAEWCLDAPLGSSAALRDGDGRRGEVPPAEKEHLLRGGSYADPASRATCTFRAVAFGRNANSLASVRAARAVR